MIDGILNKKLKGEKWFFYTKLTNVELDGSFLTLETTVDKNNLQLKVHLPPLVYFVMFIMFNLQLCWWVFCCSSLKERSSSTL